MGDVTAWPKDGGTLAPQPEPIWVAADHGLEAAVAGLVSQLGSTEAYNRLVRRAEALRSRIEAGHGKPPNPLYAVRPEIRAKPWCSDGS